MFFERETLNLNNEKYLVKTIGYKLQYTIYGSTTTAIANLISLANIGPRVKFHHQLHSSLVLSSYQKKITNAVYNKNGGLRRQRTEDKAFISLHLKANQIRKGLNTHVVSLSTQDFITHSFSVHAASVKLFHKFVRVKAEDVLHVFFEVSVSILMVFLNLALYYACNILEIAGTT